MYLFLNVIKKTCFVQKKHQSPAELRSLRGLQTFGPSSALWLTVQHYMSKMQLPWKKYMSILSYCRMSLVVLQDITVFFSQGQLRALCTSAGTTGMGLMTGREKKERGSPRSSAQEVIRSVDTCHFLVWMLSNMSHESYFYILADD